jgi:hypothetical protein
MAQLLKVLGVSGSTIGYLRRPALVHRLLASLDVSIQFGFITIDICVNAFQKTVGAFDLSPGSPAAGCSCRG